MKKYLSYNVYIARLPQCGYFICSNKDYTSFAAYRRRGGGSQQPVILTIDILNDVLSFAAISCRIFEARSHTLLTLSCVFLAQSNPEMYSFCQSSHLNCEKAWESCRPVRMVLNCSV
jgi:hypothetical protein